MSIIKHYRMLIVRVVTHYKRNIFAWGGRVMENELSMLKTEVSKIK